MPSSLTLQKRPFPRAEMIPPALPLPFTQLTTTRACQNRHGQVLVSASNPSLTIFIQVAIWLWVQYPGPPSCSHPKNDLISLFRCWDVNGTHGLQMVTTHVHRGFHPTTYQRRPGLKCCSPAFAIPEMFNLATSGYSIMIHD